MLNKTKGMGEVSNESPKIQCPFIIKHFPMVLLGQQNQIFSDSIASLSLISFSVSFFISIAKVLLNKHSVEPKAL